MPTFAVLDGNMVSNVIVADDQEAAESALGVRLVPYDDDNPAGIGWTYDAETGTFIQPVPDPIAENL